MNNGKVERIISDCGQGDSLHWEKAGGISCNDLVDRIVNLYGNSKEISVSDDKLQRIYNYSNYNLAFILSKSKVDALMVFDGKLKPTGYHFIPLSSVVTKEAENEKPWEGKHNSWKNDPIVIFGQQDNS